AVQPRNRTRLPSPEVIGNGANPPRNIVKTPQNGFDFTCILTPKSALHRAEMIGLQHGNGTPARAVGQSRYRCIHAATPRALVPASQVARSVFARAVIACFFSRDRSGPRKRPAIGGKNPKLIFI